MQNKTPARYYQPTRMAKNKSLTITNVDDDREQVKPIQHWWKHELINYFRKKYLAIPTKSKSNLWLNNSIPRYIIQEK